MPTPRTRPLKPTTLILAALCALAPGLEARSKNPLDRVTPVPADEPIPTIDYFRPPLFSRPRLNYNGTMFAAFVTAERERQALLVCDLASGQLQLLDPKTDKDIYSFSWLSDKRIMFRLSVEKRYASGVHIANIHSMKRIETYPIERHSATRTIGIPRKNRLHPIIWVTSSAYEDGRDGGILQLDSSRRLVDESSEIRGMRGTQYESTAHGIKASVVRSYPTPKGGVPINYFADLDGELAWAITRADGMNTLHRFTDGAWVRTDFDLERYDIVDVGDAPGELLVLETGESDRPRGLQRFDVATGTPGEVLFRDEKYDFDQTGIVRHPVTKHVLGVGLNRARWENVWFDPKYARVQASVEKQFPGECIQIIDTDDAEKRFFIAAWSDRKPAAYYIADLEKGTFGLVKSSRPWIDPARMQPTQVVRYKTRDGFEIEGYLTLPAGVSKQKPAPLIVHPHGGPWVRDVWGWDPVVQFLASRGYAVLQPNYRGSPSYTWQFTAADMWAFRKMHDDVTDGVAAIKRTGLIDPDRIAIMGGSFGGYLAVCGAAFEPDLYRCAVTIAGVFDWERMIREVRRIDQGGVRADRLMRKLGDRSLTEAGFEEISPLRHLDKVRVPLFVAHGTDDQVVDVAQSRRLANELERLKKPFVSHFTRGEGHSMDFVKNEVELYTKIEAFLAQHLAPRGAP